MLYGRRSECEVLGRLLDAAREGESRVLVVRGEPGVGKSVLLEHVVGRASGWRVLRAVGVQSEMELAFAGLQQLCAPMLSDLERLPVPQREALGVAFGLTRRARRRIAFWLVSPCWDCCRRWRVQGRWSAWSMMRSGLIGRLCSRLSSWRAACWLSQWRWCSRSAKPGQSICWRGCRSWWSRVCEIVMRGRCWVQ